MFQILTKWIVELAIPRSHDDCPCTPLVALFGADFAVGWPILVIGMLVLAYVVLVGCAPRFGLDADEKVVAQTALAWLRNTVRKTEVNA